MPICLNTADIRRFETAREGERGRERERDGGGGKETERGRRDGEGEGEGEGRDSSMPLHCFVNMALGRKGFEAGVP